MTLLNDPIIRSNQASGAFRRLEFENFGAPLAPPPAPEPPPVLEVAPPPEPEPAFDAPFEVAPGIPLPTAEDIERIQAEAHKEGYALGYEEGSARGRIEASELHQLLTQFDETLSSLDESIGAEILALSLEIARLVVRETLARQPESMVTIVREALAQMPQQHAAVHINPEDAALVRQYLGEQITHAGHRIVEDMSVERGGCRIDSPGAQIDASLATRWRRVVENLSRDHPWDDPD